MLTSQNLLVMNLKNSQRSAYLLHWPAANSRRSDRRKRDRPMAEVNRVKRMKVVVAVARVVEVEEMVVVAREEEAEGRRGS